ncbi:uncharacterized protein LOC120336317 [Styela clava]
MSSENLESSTSGETDSEVSSYISLEIGDKEGGKWISSNRALNDNIPVELRPDVLEQWRVERRGDEALWSFHVISSVNRKKLYVTYNDNNNDVTLQYEDNGENKKGRFFAILIYPGHGMLLRAGKSRDRYLRHTSGKLYMVTTENPTEDIMWLITPSFTLIQSVLAQFMVQILEAHSSQKWISWEASEHLPIQTQQLSAKQDWMMSIENDLSIKFAAGDLYADKHSEYVYLLEGLI